MTRANDSYPIGIRNSYGGLSGYTIFGEYYGKHCVDTRDIIRIVKSEVVEQQYLVVFKNLENNGAIVTNVLTKEKIMNVHKAKAGVGGFTSAIFEIISIHEITIGDEVRVLEIMDLVKK